jgi:hypothetical protein
MDLWTAFSLSEPYACVGPCPSLTRDLRRAAHQALERAWAWRGSVVRWGFVDGDLDARATAPSQPVPE